MARYGEISTAVAAAEAFPADQRIPALVEARDQLNALIGAEIVEFVDAGGLYETRYSNPASWLVANANIAKSGAQKLLNNGRLAQRFDAIAEAVSEGVLTTDHLDLLRRCLPTNRTRRRAELFGRDHKALIDIAREDDLAEFRRRTEAWIQAADAIDDDITSPEEKDLSLNFTDNGDGTTTINGRILTTDAQIIIKALLTLLTAAKQQANTTADGIPIPDETDELSLSEYTLRPVIRRGKKYWMAKALGMLALAATKAPADGKAPEPLVIVTMDFETFQTEKAKYAEWVATGQPPPPTDPAEVLQPHYRSETLEGVPILPGEAFRMALDHRIARAVIDAASRKVDLGRTQRLFTGAARLAVQVRDRICTTQGCGNWATQIDHIQEWADGGPTNTTNGDNLCNPCHRHKTQHAEQQRQSLKQRLAYMHDPTEPF